MRLIERGGRLEPSPVALRQVARLTAVAALGLLLAAPLARAEAQGLAWMIAPSAILDTEFLDETRIGPGITGEVEVWTERPLSYFAAVSLARTDFPIAQFETVGGVEVPAGAHEYHQNYGSVALGIRLTRDGDGPRFGLLFGIGALFRDNVNETDPAFRSSADAEEMLLPGIDVRWPVRDGFGVTFSVRDQVTGWWNAVLDPSEGALSHRLIIAAGLSRR